MKKVKAIFLLFLFILLSSLIISYTINGIISNIPITWTWDTSNEIEKYTLLEIIDWDTVKIKDNKDEKSYSIRMIWLDAPEKTTTRYWYIECFWNEATEHLKTLLSWANEIWLELDNSQGLTDKYWRILWYVYYSWENLNQKMIKDGYGFEYTYNLPYKYQKSFKKAEKNARINQLWLWNKNTCDWKRESI